MIQLILESTDDCSCIGRSALNWLESSPLVAFAEELQCFPSWQVAAVDAFAASFPAAASAAASPAAAMHPRESP